MRYYDNLMRRVRGQQWIDWKNEKAIERTHQNLPVAIQPDWENRSLGDAANFPE
jgi:hypothetical protein